MTVVGKIYASPVMIAKAIITLLFAFFAAVSAMKAVEETTAGKKMITREGIAFIFATGLCIGLTAIIIPVSWPIDLVLMTIFGMMMFLNSEGPYRVASWGTLSLLSGIMLCFGMAGWQDAKIGGIKPWMPITGFLLSCVPIVIGIWLCVTNRIDNGKEKENKAKVVLLKNRKIVGAVMGILLITAVVISGSALIVAVFRAG